MMSLWPSFSDILCSPSLVVLNGFDLVGDTAHHLFGALAALVVDGRPRLARVDLQAAVVALVLGRLDHHHVDVVESNGHGALVVGQGNERVRHRPPSARKWPGAS